MAEGGTIKRGGGQSVLSLDFEAANTRYTVGATKSVTPEDLFEQQWAVALINSALTTERPVAADTFRLPSDRPPTSAFICGLCGILLRCLGHGVEINDTTLRTQRH